MNEQNDTACVFSYDEKNTLLEILNKQIEQTPITHFKKHLQDIRKKIGA